MFSLRQLQRIFALKIHAVTKLLWRLSFFVTCVTICLPACAQTTPTGSDLFQTAKPQVAVAITKHAIGWDLVTVTALNPNYPPALLKQQVETLCSNLKAPARGLQVYTTSFRKDTHDLDFLRATFGTNGLIEGNGAFNVCPIVSAFAGAPRPFEITVISIEFDDQVPTSNTLKSFGSETVSLQARQNKDPVQGVEFMVRLLSQDPNAIVIPDHFQPLTPNTQAPQTKANSGWPLWLALIVGAAAVGALVYLVLLRLPADGRKTPSGRHNK